MKRNRLALVLCLTALTAFGCGQQGVDSGPADTETETGSETDAGQKPAYEGARSAAMELNLEKLVKKLADYDGIDVTITGNYEVTDETVADSLGSLLSMYGAGPVKVTDRDVVQDGDYVMIDYTGYKDGAAFDRGAATDVLMDVSNNRDMTSGSTYIDGFCDDLVGARVGDTLHTDVTFPENYQSEELAGQPAVFEITVKGIYEPLTVDMLTDEMVTDIFSEQEITTVDGLKKKMRETLEAQMAAYMSQDTMTAVQTYMIDHSEVEIPQEYMDARMAEMEYSTAIDNCSEGQTLAEFLEANGTTLEEQRQRWKVSVEQQIKSEFLFGRIAQLENLELDEADFQSYVDYLVESNSIKFSSAEDVYSYYGVGYADEGEKALRELFTAQKAMSFVADHANVTVEEE